MARKKKVATEAKPFHDQARAKQQEAARWKERFDALWKFKPIERDEDAIAEADGRIRELTKEASALAAKATDIENAVYDLKALNPNKNPQSDTRTPEELLAIIEAKGKEIEAALALLRNPRNTASATPSPFRPNGTTRSAASASRNGWRAPASPRAATPRR